MCLGSHIESSIQHKNIVTSLFQDTWEKSSSSTPPPEIYYCNNGKSEMTKYDFNADTILVDRNGNKYYTPASVSNQLKFHRKVQQDSKSQSGEKIAQENTAKLGLIMVSPLRTQIIIT